MKTLAAILLVLPIALVVASNGDCKSHVSKTYQIGVSLSIKSPCECESLEEDNVDSKYMKVVEKICKNGRCTVESLEGSCTQASEYSVNISLSLPCPACKKNVNRVTRSLQKKGLKIKRKGGACRLKSPTVSTPELINYVCATEPPTTESPPTTLEPTTQVLTTAPPPTTPVPTTIQATTPPPITYGSISGSRGSITIPEPKCTTICGECKLTNDPKVMVVVQSLTPAPPACPGLTLSDGECNALSPYIQSTYLPVHTHVSKSRCACVCIPPSCPSHTIAKLYYASYEPSIEEVVHCVLELEEAKALAEDDALLSKLTVALCDKTKALSLISDPSLASLIKLVPPQCALKFLGRKRK